MYESYTVTTEVCQSRRPDRQPQGHRRMYENYICMFDDSVITTARTCLAQGSLFDDV
jgi:hypothetical protein